MLRLPRGRYEITPESQARPEGNQAVGGKIRRCAALRPVPLRPGARRQAQDVFRTATAVTFGVKFTATNTGNVRANLTILYQAKAQDDTVLF